MSTPISRIEVTCDAPTLVGQTVDGIHVPVLAGRGLYVGDGTAPYDQFCLVCFLSRWDAVNGFISLGGSAPGTEWVTNYQALHAFAGPSGLANPLWEGGLAGTPIQLLDNGASFFAGGTLAIEKDYDNNLLTFKTPAGDIAVALNSVYPPGPEPFTASPPSQSAGVGSWLSPGSNDTVDASDTTRWYNFFFKIGGVPVNGAALSVADPGFWQPWKDEVFAAPATGELRFDDGQETARYRARSYYVGGSFVDGDGSDQWRDFLGPSFSSLKVALTRAPEHGSLYGAVVYAADPGTVRFRQTYDSGRSWTETNLFSDAATTNETPALAWSGGRLSVVWRKNSALVQSVSSDLGATWGTPMALAITGTNPFLLVDPNHGLQYYFYLDASADLQLVRSGDFGHTFIDATPHLVAATIGQQTIAAELASDGSLLVGYVVAGAWTQKRSKDLGVTWS